MKNKKEIFGWAMFDFANSAYTTNIVTVIFAVYFVQGLVPEDQESKKLWGLCLLISNLLIILTAPVIGAIGDFSSSRKKILIFTCLCCVIGTAGLYFAAPGAVVLAIFLFVVSNYFFQVSESICSSFLPNLAPSDQLGRISGFGWALGYMGGLLSLFICVPYIQGGFGADNADNLRFTNLLTAGVFFFAAIPTFILLREHGAPETLPPGKGYVGIGFERVKITLSHLSHLKDLALFLIVFLVISIPLTTIFSFSTIYATEEMGFTATDLMMLFIIIQVSAAAGAFGFGFVQDRFGIKRSIQILLIYWFLTLVVVYFTESVPVFKGLALLLGAGLGSVQSAARALIGYMAPESKAGEMFGFWSLTYKLGGMVGPILYGFVSEDFSHRAAMLTISVFFLIAFILNHFVDPLRGRKSAIEFEAELQKMKP